MTYTITRYSNRKFYSKAHGTYLSLKEIGKIKDNDWVVLCHKTGRDITKRIKIEVDYRNALSKLEESEGVWQPVSYALSTTRIR